MSEGQIKNPGSEFVDPLLADLNQDRDSLLQLIERVSSAKPILKQASARIVEKLHRFKLSIEDEKLGEFQALEFLALGILGKQALWRALREAADPLDARMRGTDFERLIERAEAQHAIVEERRLSLAAGVFAPSTQD